MSRQPGERELLAMVNKQAVGFSIIGLFAARSPAAIARLVAAVVVRPSVERIALTWMRPHVGKKILELGPSLADGNALSAIMLEGWVRRVRAALVHVLPCGVFSASSVSWAGRMTMGAKLTSTGMGLSVSEGYPLDNSLGAAHASA